MNKKICLIGAGTMAIEYAKVLIALQVPFVVIGRGETSAESFNAKTGIDVFKGGLELYLSKLRHLPTHAIVAVGVEQLSHVTNQLLQYDIKNILVEKPGGLTIEELAVIENLAKQQQANVYIAYNRRFYASVIKAKEIIEEDGGVSSFHFEFTEWAHLIEKLDKPKNILANWFLANSTHVADLAFFLGGYPMEMKCFTTGELSWHKPAIFSGAGITDSNALFSYHANWGAPGRWSVEICTTKHRLYFRPMETLQIQEIGSIAVTPVEIDDKLDKEFKPGLFLQTQSFLNENYMSFCSLKEQYDNAKNIYSKICMI